MHYASDEILKANKQPKFLTYLKHHVYKYTTDRDYSRAIMIDQQGVGIILVPDKPHHKPYGFSGSFKDY